MILQALETARNGRGKTAEQGPPEPPPALPTVPSAQGSPSLEPASRTSHPQHRRPLLRERAAPLLGSKPYLIASESSSLEIFAAIIRNGRTLKVKERRLRPRRARLSRLPCHRHCRRSPRSRKPQPSHPCIHVHRTPHPKLKNYSC